MTKSHSTTRILFLPHSLFALLGGWAVAVVWSEACLGLLFIASAFCRHYLGESTSVRIEGLLVSLPLVVLLVGHGGFLIGLRWWWYSSKREQPPYQHWCIPVVGWFLGWVTLWYALAFGEMWPLAAGWEKETTTGSSSINVLVVAMSGAILFCFSKAFFNGKTSNKSHHHLLVLPTTTTASA